MENEDIKEAKPEEKQKKKKVSNKKKKLTQADIKKYSSTQIDHVILKIKANERKYTIITVCLILVIFLSSSYIIFSSVQKRDNLKAAFKSGSLYYEFDDEVPGFSDTIEFIDEEPLSDSDGLKTKAYKIKLYNSSFDTKKYKIYIYDDLDVAAADQCKDNFIKRDFIKYSLDGKGFSFLESDDKKEILEGEISGKKTVNYTLHVWISDTYSDSSTHYHGKIIIKEIDEKKE